MLTQLLRRYPRIHFSPITLQAHRPMAGFETNALAAVTQAARAAFHAERKRARERAPMDAHDDVRATPPSTPE